METRKKKNKQKQRDVKKLNWKCRKAFIFIYIYTYIKKYSEFRVDRLEYIHSFSLEIRAKFECRSGHLHLVYIPSGVSMHREKRERMNEHKRDKAKEIESFVYLQQSVQFGIPAAKLFGICMQVLAALHSLFYLTFIDLYMCKTHLKIPISSLDSYFFFIIINKSAVFYFFPKISFFYFLFSIFLQYQKCTTVLNFFLNSQKGDLNFFY